LPELARVCREVILFVSPREVELGWVVVGREEIERLGEAERRVVKRWTCARARAEERVPILRARWGEEINFDGGTVEEVEWNGERVAIGCSRAH